MFMKKKIVVAVLALLALCLAVSGCAARKKDAPIQNSAEKAPFRQYTLLLPTGMTFEADRKDLQNGNIYRDETIVGGLISVPRTWEEEEPVTPNQPLYSPSKITADAILAAMEEAGAPGDRESFDYMLESSLSADCEVWYGNREEEYKHYIYVFEDGLMDLWFDQGLVDAEQANKIAADFSVDR